MTFTFEQLSALVQAKTGKTIQSFELVTMTSPDLFTLNNDLSNEVFAGNIRLSGSIGYYFKLYGTNTLSINNDPAAPYNDFRNYENILFNQVQCDTSEDYEFQFSGYKFIMST